MVKDAIPTERIIKMLRGEESIPEYMGWVGLMGTAADRIAEIGEVNTNLRTTIMKDNEVYKKELSIARSEIETLNQRNDVLQDELKKIQPSEEKPFIEQLQDISDKIYKLSSLTGENIIHLLENDLYDRIAKDICNVCDDDHI